MLGRLVISKKVWSDKVVGVVADIKTATIPCFLDYPVEVASSEWMEKIAG